MEAGNETDKDMVYGIFYCPGIRRMRYEEK